jgi:hypothetical protein
MHPVLFSIGLEHLGHGLVCARIQVMFSLSALFFTSHRRTVAQSTGRCASSAHAQQKNAPHLHATSTALVGPMRDDKTEIARSHPGATHHFTRGLSSTNERHENRACFARDAAESFVCVSFVKNDSGTRVAHPACGHRASRQDGPSSTFASRYPDQHCSQKSCPHPQLVNAVRVNPSKHTWHVCFPSRLSEPSRGEPRDVDVDAA